jgi:hypothetical protein
MPSKQIRVIVVIVVRPREVLPLPLAIDYSLRRATDGSTRDARSAGT